MKKLLAVSIMSAIIISAIGIGCQTTPVAPVDGRFNVKDFGAKGSGWGLDTRAIQKAVDAAAALGDPNVEVYFPAGEYITKAIILKNNVTIHMDEGALLQASKDPGDWPDYKTNTNVEEQVNSPRRAVFYGQSLQNITLKGKGIIDGAGGYDSPYYTQPNNAEGRPAGEFVIGPRPQSIMYIRDSKNVNISGLTLRNSVRWTCVLELCDQVHIDGMIIRNPPYDIGREADGIDLNTSSNVLVENCDIECGDDAITIKPQRDYFQKPPRIQENIVIRNCVIATTCNAVKIGTGTYVALNNMLVENITVNRHSGKSLPDEETGNTTPRSATSAISVQSNDGGVVTNLVYRNFTINDCDTGMFIGLQQRKRVNAYTQELGMIDGVTFENINILKANKASQINTQDGGIVKNVTYRNITQHTTEAYKHSVRPPRMTGSYPDADGFGSMPSFGIFARNVDGLVFEGKLDFFDDARTGRPKYSFENCVNISGVPASEDPYIIDITEYPRFPERNPAFTEAFDEKSFHDREGSARWPADINRGPVGCWTVKTVSGVRVIEKGDSTNRFLRLNVPGAKDWENYWIHAKVWPGKKEHRVPANTQISYRVTDRHERVAVALARSNKGYVRLNRYDPFINKETGEKDSAGDQVLQLGFAEVANEVSDKDMKFFDLDIVCDGPYISIYVDGKEKVRDFYDESWNAGRKKGTISIGGAPVSRFGDIKVTLIENSSLATTSATVSRSNAADLPVNVNLNGNHVIKLRNGKTWLRAGTDYTIEGSVVTLSRSFLAALPAGRTEITFCFNLGVRELPFTLNVQ